MIKVCLGIASEIQISFHHSHISVIWPLMPKNFCHTNSTPPQYGCSCTYLAYFMSSSASKSLSTSYLWKVRKISLLWIVRIWFYLGQNNEMATTIDSMVILQYFWIKLNQLAQVIGAKTLAPWWYCSIINYQLFLKLKL